MQGCFRLNRIDLHVTFILGVFAQSLTFAKRNMWRCHWSDVELSLLPLLCTLLFMGKTVICWASKLGKESIRAGKMRAWNEGRVSRFLYRLLWEVSWSLWRFTGLGIEWVIPWQNFAIQVGQVIRNTLFDEMKPPFSVWKNKIKRINTCCLKKRTVCCFAIEKRRRRRSTPQKKKCTT